jgi:hypothetical protein
LQEHQGEADTSSNMGGKCQLDIVCDLDLFFILRSAADFHIFHASISRTIRPAGNDSLFGAFVGHNKSCKETRSGIIIIVSYPYTVIAYLI